MYICEAAPLGDCSPASGVPGAKSSDCTSAPSLHSRLLCGANKQPGRSQVRPCSRQPLQDQCHSILYCLILWSHFISVSSVSVDVRVDVDPTRTSEAVKAKHVGYREAQQPVSTHDLPICQVLQTGRSLLQRHLAPTHLVPTGTDYITTSGKPCQVPYSEKSNSNADLECWRPTCASLQGACHVRHRCLLRSCLCAGN